RVNDAVAVQVDVAGDLRGDHGTRGGVNELDRPALQAGLAGVAGTVAVAVVELLAADLDRRRDRHADAGAGGAAALVPDRVGEGVGTVEAGVGRVRHGRTVRGNRHPAVGALRHGFDGQTPAIGAVVGQDVDAVGAAVLAHRGGVVVDHRCGPE